MNPSAGRPIHRPSLALLLSSGLAMVVPLASFAPPAHAAVAPPRVGAQAPAAGATGVPVNRVVISAAFDQPVDPFGGAASFAVTCSAPCTNPAGTVSLDATKTIAYFALAPGELLEPNTRYRARVSGARSSASGLQQATFTWNFDTGVTTDTTRPTVTATLPATRNNQTVRANSAITAYFSEEMAPASIGRTTFTLSCTAPCTAPIGDVAYHVGTRSATFRPQASLQAGRTYTARVTNRVRDLSGRTMERSHLWTFEAIGAVAPAPVSVRSVKPANNAVTVCPDAAINATFDVPSGLRLDPATVNANSFTVRESTGAHLRVTAASVVLDRVLGRTATFRPLAALTSGVTYTARIAGGPGGVLDQARSANDMAADFTWTFTAGDTTRKCLKLPDLGAAAPFAVFGGNATVTSDGLGTQIDGDVGVNAVSTTITGLRDGGGNVYTVTPDNDGLVNGLVYTTSAPPGSPAGVAVLAAREDALAAFNAMARLRGGIDMSSLADCPSCGGIGGGHDELAGRTLPPGLYRSTTGTFDLGGSGRTTADLVLDARGDPHAIWIFQAAAGTGTLNVGITGPATPAVPLQMRLVNGAQAGNVFWFVPGGAHIGTGSTIVGTLLATSSITVSTTGGSPPTAVATTIDGRLITLTAAITMTNTVVNVPAP